MQSLLFQGTATNFRATFFSSARAKIKFFQIWSCMTNEKTNKRLLIKFLSWNYTESSCHIFKPLQLVLEQLIFECTGKNRVSSIMEWQGQCFGFWPLIIFICRTVWSVYLWNKTYFSKSLQLFLKCTDKNRVYSDVELQMFWSDFLGNLWMILWTTILDHFLDAFVILKSWAQDRVSFDLVHKIEADLFV